MDILNYQEAKKCFLEYLAINKNSQAKGAKLENFIIRFQKYIPLLHDLNIKSWRKFAHEWNLSGSDEGVDLIGDARNGVYPIQVKNYVGLNKIERKDIDAFCNNITILRIPNKPIKNAFLFFNGTLSKCASDLINKKNSSLKKDNKDWEIKIYDLDQIFPDLYESLSHSKSSDLASADDFKKFLSSCGYYKKEPKTLRKYQEEAVAKAYEHYIVNKNHRGQMIMACGTGKTLTSLAIINKITEPTDLILFLVPTLDLMRQTIKKARIDIDYDFEGFAVCSDHTTIKDDDISIEDAEIPINQILRHPWEMKKYYAEWNQTKQKRLIVFCTYQSIKKIVAAQEDGFPEFKLVICDEAHRTVGLKDKKIKETPEFKIVHDNSKIKIQNRLYMTATPKLFDVSKKTDKTLQDNVLWDMSDEDVYGKDFFTYSFTTGVENKYLSDFQVVILGLIEDEFQATYDKYSLLSETEEQIDKKILSMPDFVNLIGIRKIIDEHKIKKAISFCRYATKNKGNSKYITNFFNNHIANEDPDTYQTRVTMEHIDGTMISSYRKKILSKFDENNNQCLIISNARCLSEGIDVPTLDAVIFMHPRKSKVDIVQAVGRVMRISKRKNIGKVIIPVIAKLKTAKDKSISVDLDKNSFKTVSEILNALRSPQVKPNITNKINNVRELGDKFPDKDIEIRIIVDPDKLAKAIRCKMNQGFQNWIAETPGGG